MSYIATGGVIERIRDIFKTGATVAYGIDAAKQAAQTGTAPAMPAEEPFNWTPVLMIGGIALVAVLLLKKK
jgi:hypothetical protein